MLAIVGVIASSYIQPNHSNSIVLGGVTYFHDNYPIGQNEKLYLYQNANDLASNLSGTDDIDGDGNLDDWSTNASGELTWTIKIVYPNYFVAYSINHYYAGTMTSGTTTIYNSPYSSAIPIVNTSGSYNAGTAVDLDNNGNLDDWNIDASGLITFTEVVLHNYTISLLPNGFPSPLTLYTDSSTPTQGMIIYNGPGTGANIYANNSGQNDVDNDGNADSWYTNSSGQLFWSMIIVHAYSIILQGTTYYYDSDPIQSGINLYTGQGSGATLPSGYMTGADDINNDSIIEIWILDNGYFTFTV
jgi:hypothetical protein